jgi:hypothetical protein
MTTLETVAHCLSLIHERVREKSASPGASVPPAGVRAGMSENPQPAPPPPFTLAPFEKAEPNSASIVVLVLPRPGEATEPAFESRCVGPRAVAARSTVRKSIDRAFGPASPISSTALAPLRVLEPDDDTPPVARDVTPPVLPRARSLSRYALGFALGVLSVALDTPPGAGGEPPAPPVVVCFPSAERKPDPCAGDEERARCDRKAPSKNVLPAPKPCCQVSTPSCELATSQAPTRDEEHHCAQ